MSSCECFARIFVTRNCCRRQESSWKRGGRTRWKKKDFRARSKIRNLVFNPPNLHPLGIRCNSTTYLHCLGCLRPSEVARETRSATEKENVAAGEIERKGEDQYVHEVGCVERERVTSVLSVKDYREVARL